MSLLFSICCCYRHYPVLPPCCISRSAGSLPLNPHGLLLPGRSGAVVVLHGEACCCPGHLVSREIGMLRHAALRRASSDLCPLVCHLSLATISHRHCGICNDVSESLNMPALLHDEGRRSRSGLGPYKRCRDTTSPTMICLPDEGKHPSSLTATCSLCRPQLIVFDTSAFSHFPELLVHAACCATSVRTRPPQAALGTFTISLLSIYHGVHPHPSLPCPYCDRERHG